MRQDSAVVFSKPILGRPTIIAVRVGNSVIRIQIPWRTIAIIRITAKTGGFCPAAISTCLPDFGGKVLMLFLDRDDRILFFTKSQSEGACSPLYSACSGAAPANKAWADPPLLRIVLETAEFAYKNRGEQAP